VQETAPAARRGYVPASHLALLLPPAAPGPTAPPSAGEASVLAAAAALPATLPAGVLPAALAQAAREPGRRLEDWLRPAPGPGGLTVADMSLDPLTGVMHAVSAAVTRSVLVLEAVDLPAGLAAAGAAVPPSATVIARTVRVALCDEATRGLLSNVLAITAGVASSNPRRWSCDRQGVLAGIPGADAQDSLCLIRCREGLPGLAVVFELSLTYCLPGAPESVEVSCGWALLPLFVPPTSAAKGATPAPARSYALPLRAGLVLAAGTGVMAASAAPTLKTPTLHVRLANLKKGPAQLCSCLPATLVVSLTTVPVLTAYRGALADALRTQAQSLARAGPSHARAAPPLVAPALAAVAKAAGHPFLLQAIKRMWVDTLARMKSAVRRDPVATRQAFLNLALQRIWPLLHVLPPFGSDDHLDAAALQPALDRYLACTDPAAELGHPEAGFLHEPFSTEELQLSILA
jgi:hypothetical protein